MTPLIRSAVARALRVVSGGGGPGPSDPLIRTNLLQQRTNGGASSAFTPPNNSLLVVVVGVTVFSGSADPSADITIANSAGLTFTPRVTIGSAAPWSRGMRIFTAPVTTGVSMTITPSMIHSIYSIDAHVFAYENYDVASPIGAVASSNTVADGGPRTITLNASPAATSEVLSAVHINGTGNTQITHGTGWTEQYDNGGGNIQFQSQTRIGSTSATVTWDNIPATFQGTASVAAALEIKQAA